MNWKIKASGRLQLEFGGIDYEFRELITLTPTSVDSFISFFFITWTSGIAVFFFTSAIQCRTIWNGSKHLIEILPLLVALNVC